VTTGRQRKAAANKLRRAKRNEKKKKETKEEKQIQLARQAKTSSRTLGKSVSRCPQ
jgi:hypothetical protein